MFCKKRIAIEKKGKGKRKYAAVRRQAAMLAVGILFAGSCVVLPLQAEEEARPDSSSYVQGEESVSDNDAQSEPPITDADNLAESEESQQDAPNPNDENTPNPEQTPKDPQDSDSPKQKAKNKPTITSQPENVRVEAGDCAYFNVSATGENLTYQWYVDKGDGRGFRQVNGANEALYRVMVFDGSMNGYIYKCRVECNSENNTASNSESKKQSREEDSKEPDENYVESRAAKLTIFYKIVGGARGVWVKSRDRKSVV